MKLREVKISGFRNLVDICIPISDLTIFIGANSAGKTSVLEAINLALSSRLRGRDGHFDDYDYFLEKSGDSPKDGREISIELWFKEDSANEWPETLIQALTDIIVTDLVLDLDSLRVRLVGGYDSAVGQYFSRWEFLNIDGVPLTGKGATPQNFQKFLKYMRIFFLKALRNPSEEFSVRGQYWGKILKDLKIPPEQMEELENSLGELNAKLLSADARLEEVTGVLDKVQRVFGFGGTQKTDVQALPIRPWDLMSKAELILRNTVSKVSLPLSRQGQGIQSMSIFYLFQAFIEVLMKPEFAPETAALIIFEEPEAHLHPHAIRALTNNLKAVDTQKLISTHSPYVIQEIRFKDIRMLRQQERKAKILFIKQSFSFELPVKPELLTFCSNSAGKYSFDTGSSKLVVRSSVEEKERRKLLAIYANETQLHAGISLFAKESRKYLSDSDISDLELYVKRTRGDILFGRAWILCEGPGDYEFIRFFSECLGKNLDMAGISVICFMENGSLGKFIGLAEAFEIPWIAFVDNDNAGNVYVNECVKQGFDLEEARTLVRRLPGDDPIALELFLFDNGFENELRDVVSEFVDSAKRNAPRIELVGLLHGTGGPRYMQEVIRKIGVAGNSSTRVPVFFSQLINDILGKIEP